MVCFNFVIKLCCTINIISIGLPSGLSRHPVEGLERKCSGEASVGIRTVRPERRRTNHEKGDAGRGDLHLRDARQIHGAFGAG